MKLRYKKLCKKQTKQTDQTNAFFFLCFFHVLTRPLVTQRAHTPGAEDRGDEVTTEEGEGTRSSQGHHWPFLLSPRPVNHKHTG